jgi:hypothetical protein
MGGFRVVTNSEHPELEAQIQEFRGEWPEFIFHDPVSAAHVDRVSQALDLVSIDREQDQGSYEETNLWMRHA